MARDGDCARDGAGRRSKALADKVALGKLVEVIALPEPSEMERTDVLPVKEYMKISQKSDIELYAEDVFKRTYLWLKERGCERFVNTQLSSTPCQCRVEMGPV